MTAPRTHPPHQVYIATKWEDAWELVEGLYCDGFSFAAAPDVAEAQLSYNYGKVQGANETTIATREPLDLNGKYVKVVLSQATSDSPGATPQRWVGLVVETQGGRHGNLNLGGSRIESGRQVFQCRGLEFLLQRKTITSSWIQDSEGAESEVGRAIGFNLGQGRDTDHLRKGNRGTVGLYDAPVFAPSFDDSEEWTAYDIVTYLLYYHPPSDIDENDQLGWTIDDEDSAAILVALKPTLAAEGKTVKQLFDEAIDRRRLIGWTVTYDVEGEDEESDGGAPRIHVFTFSDEQLTLPSGEIIAGNQDSSIWYIDDQRELNSAILSEDDATRYDVVIARGESLTSTFTIGDSRENSLVEDWDDTLAVEYNAGATGASGYSGWDDTKKEAAHAIIRGSPKFEKFGRYFRLQNQFVGILGGNEVCPDPLDDSSESHSNFWWPGLRFRDKLPLLTDHDYEVVEDADASDRTVDSSYPEYLRPFAIIKDDDDIYHHLDRMGQVASLSESSMENNGIGFTASLRMQDHVAGVVIDVAPQHYLLFDEFSEADDTDTQPAEFDWKTIFVTVSCEFDQHVEAKWPEDELTTETDVVRKLTIEVPNCRLDYLVPDTVIGIKDDGTVQETDGGYVRDDRELLKDIARSAFAWYGTTRNALTVVQQNLVCQRFIGELITQIGSSVSLSPLVDVNSVVTKLTFDLLAGTVTVQTQYAELDPRVGVA